MVLMNHMSLGISETRTAASSKAAKTNSAAAKFLMVFPLPSKLVLTVGVPGHSQDRHGTRHKSADEKALPVDGRKVAMSPTEVLAGASAGAMLWNRIGKGRSSPSPFGEIDAF